MDAWAPELLMFDLNIGFLVQNCICAAKEMSRIPKVGLKMMFLFYAMSGLNSFKLLLKAFRMVLKDLNMASKKVANRFYCLV